jgi:hypothetical protein
MREFIRPVAITFSIVCLAVSMAAGVDPVRPDTRLV